MDDAGEWTATAPVAGAAAAVQPGDPWGVPVWRPEPRAVDSSDAATFEPAGVRRRGAALVVDLIVIAILQAVGSGLASGIVRLAPSVYVAAQAFGLTWQLVIPEARRWASVSWARASSIRAGRRSGTCTRSGG